MIQLAEDKDETPPLTLPFEAISAEDLSRVGGKGANLGVLTRASIPVPPGFCVTTAAFEQFIAGLQNPAPLFARLEALDGNDVAEARLVAESMRSALEALPLPEKVANAIVAAWKTLGVEHPLAVRSSATAEDLPGASFAGQQDTYLNVLGEQALLDSVRRCFVSLFTDRAVLYRARNRFDHRAVKLAVVVQRLVDPQVAGILFTADPVSGHRGIVSIDAGFGLGEALVSGLIRADLYRVDRKQRAILEATAGDKAFAIRSVPGGGTRQEPLPEPMRRQRALDDAQVLALTAIGEQVEAHYRGVPQDIEWCIADGKIYVVQARPITSLFPVPTPTRDDGGLRIFLSFGHVQMMTDAMPLLARDAFSYFFPVGKGRAQRLSDSPRLSESFATAASRIYIDATPILRAPKPRKVFLTVIGVGYEELARSATVLVSRPEFARKPGSAFPILRRALQIVGPVFVRIPFVLLFGDPAKRAAQVDRDFDAFANAARERIRSVAALGARVRHIAAEINSIFATVRPQLSRLLAGLIAHRLLGAMARGKWADGVRDQVDWLLRGLPGNVTTEMDLAVGDLTDQVRPHAALATMLRERPWSEIVSRADEVEGGPEFVAAFEAFLARYGDRGIGEIDLSRPRWRDDPSMLFRVVTGGLSTPREPGAHRRHFANQAAEGDNAAKRLIEAAGKGPLGLFRRWWVSRLCRTARACLPLREHPKFAIIRVFGLVRSVMLEAGELLAQRGQLRDKSQVWHLGFEELARALDDPSRASLIQQVAQREEEFRRDQSRKPPAVISSEGESPAPVLGRAELPEGALAGTAASNGVVEGIARVIRDPMREVLHAGEILVAPFTDPGWTPLFVHAAGVVTEVGGLMTHGAVVAREYGLPAVVSVAGATERIRTGQRIRVDGTRGFVLLLKDN
jgi:pyruvate,water dikinase